MAQHLTESKPLHRRTGRPPCHVNVVFNQAKPLGHWVYRAFGNLQFHKPYPVVTGLSLRTFGSPVSVFDETRTWVQSVLPTREP